METTPAAYDTITEATGHVVLPTLEGYGTRGSTTVTDDMLKYI